MVSSSFAWCGSPLFPSHNKSVYIAPNKYVIKVGVGWKFKLRTLGEELNVLSERPLTIWFLQLDLDLGIFLKSNEIRKILVNLEKLTNCY